MDPGIFKQAIEHINDVSDVINPPVQRETATKKINRNINEFYISRLYDLFEKILKIVAENDYESCLKSGYYYFLKCNKLNTKVITDSLVELISFENNAEINEFDEIIENIGETRETLENFFQKLEEKEIKILLAGFFFWGLVNKALTGSNQTVYILNESLPKINLKIFEMLCVLLQEKDNSFKNITIFDVNEFYNDIYDKTEGFEIKIEPWLIY